MSFNQRGPRGPSVTHNKYPPARDANGRGASTVTRRPPHGKDPLAGGEGKNDTAAQMEHLKATRERLAKGRA